MSAMTRMREENLNKLFRHAKYMDGFFIHMSTEAMPNSLPVGQNSPQKCPYGLYAEQLSGSAFTAPRSKNFRSWLYRIRPSVMHSKFTPYMKQGPGEIAPSAQVSFDANDWRFAVDPNQMRWDPLPFCESNCKVDFIDGLVLYCGCGDSAVKEGLNIYNYSCNSSMSEPSDNRKVFSNSDGDFLIVPQTGSLYITTELGRIVVEPTEICVVPRGIKFGVDVAGDSRGYVLEVFKGHFELPNLGPIGANGLANIRDFKTPSAWFENIDCLAGKAYLWVNKFGSRLFKSTISHSPFDVVAWHGSYAPYKYDLKLFNTMNSVSFDHPDPSIYTVLTCPSDEPGTAVADFVIFPPRWLVTEHTFRPPYFHRNAMSEYMGMLYGQYDAKEGGFVPGGSSLHSCMTPHGPDGPTFIRASEERASPTFFNGGLAFMFETSFILKVNAEVLASDQFQKDYIKCWHKLPKLFTGKISV